jgi:hypothetical protein
MPHDRNVRKDSSADRPQREDDEPRSETIGGRSFEGASYGATEREQTRDVRLPDPAEEGDVADGGYSDAMENDDSGE